MSITYPLDLLADFPGWTTENTCDQRRAIWSVEKGVREMSMEFDRYSDGLISVDPANPTIVVGHGTKWTEAIEFRD